MIRVGTWNLAGRWTPAHLDFLVSLDCDVLLLTEVDTRTRFPEHELRVSAAPMRTGCSWAGVATRAPAHPRPDPHPASALVECGRLLWCSSVLPWAGCGGAFPWRGPDHGTRTRATLDDLLAALPREGLVWGGDWNHSLSGPEHAGGKTGRAHLLSTIDALGLEPATRHLAHPAEGLLSIDHVALPRGTQVLSSEAVSAVDAGRRLSDHDAYVVAFEMSP